MRWNGLAGFRIHPRSGKALMAACLAVVVGSSTSEVMAQDVAPATAATAAPAAAPEVTYPVGRIDFAYSVEHKDLPSVESLRYLEVTLSQDGDRWVAPRPSLPQQRISIASIGREGPVKLGSTAIRQIAAVVATSYADRGHLAVDVRVHEDDIDVEDGTDLRAGGEGEPLRYEVTLGSIAAVRTIAQGERLGAGEIVNSPKHKQLREGSPLKPATVDEEGKIVPRSGDLLKREEVEEYAYLLSRHPGRRVDVAVAASESFGDVVLDYTVSEVKPWYVYANMSNTGTEETNEWRQRFGFVHTQLTGNDDILSLEYVTSSFDDTSQGVYGTYEFAIVPHRLRAELSAYWSEFTASDLGRPLDDDRFEGSDYGASARLIWNIAQWRDTFLDVYGGVAWQNVTGNANPAAEISQEGEAAFVEPFVGLRLDRTRDTHTWMGDLRFMYGETSDSIEDIARLGRIDAEEDFKVLRGSLAHSFFIEPLLFRDEFREGKGTLANEIGLSLQAQHTFDTLPIAQQQMTMGGLYTVRGYDESVIAADDTWIVSAEYRFHVPRALGIQATPGKLLGSDFRWVPDRRLGRPDWDLILRAFTDYGYASSNSPVMETETLWGAGVGVELQIKQNFIARLDWGFVLSEIEEEADTGDNRLHVMVMVLY